MNIWTENSQENKMEKQIIKKSDFYYDLPEELIAQTPVEPRDHSRLLVVDKETGNLEHKHFYDIVDYLTPNDVLVVNNTRVIPARLYGKKKTGANIEVLIIKRPNLLTAEVLVRPGKKARKGTEIFFNDNFSCVVTDEVPETGGRIVEFKVPERSTLEAELDRAGTMPLPPYIHEKLENQERYQTVYNKHKGSSAAPTAGLHFTTELLEKIKAKGVEIIDVLLDVGLGTFRPVSEENVLDHKMHSEHMVITKETAEKLNNAKRTGKRIIAVGTTSVRTLESAVNANGEIEPCDKDTAIFIYPGVKIKFVDALITNFHLPESTLVMLVSAFMGREQTLETYKTAVREKYRFFSFGDSMFIN